MRIVAVVLLALALVGCEEREEQRVRINKSLPRGCEIRDLGRYNGMDLVAVVCRANDVATTNWSERRGKSTIYGVSAWIE